MNPTPSWQGELWLASDYGLLAGTAGTTRPHAHYAHQLLIAQRGEVQALIGGQLQCAPVLVIESGVEHAILAPEQPTLTLFAEPLAFELQAVHQCCIEAGASMERLAKRIDDLPRRTLDARLAKALHRVRALEDETLPAEVLAREAALSISQLERLFTGSLGVSVRRLVLWHRLRRALALALAGSTLTAAAMAAGFSDSAHLSRSVRKQFGVRADLTLRHLRLRVLG